VLGEHVARLETHKAKIASLCLCPWAADDDVDSVVADHNGVVLHVRMDRLDQPDTDLAT